MKILIDTFVLIECGKDEELKLAIEKIAGKNDVRSSEIIDEEIERAYNLLRKEKRDYKFRDFYFKLEKATIRESTAVKKLASEYYSEGQKLGLRVKEMKADLAIVACASLDDVDFVLTLNRKTMSSDLARNVYTLVNSRRRLKTPHFLTDKLTIRRFSHVV